MLKEKLYIKLIFKIFMPSKTSAGLLMYKIKDNRVFVFLVHPGGPYWKDKERGSWSIPKGEIDEHNGESNDFLKTAIREMKEETGIAPPKENTHCLYLNTIKQKSGKTVHAWTFEGDWHGLLMCQSFVEIEYPNKSGKIIKIPEVDKADFFSVKKAKEKINPAQIPFLERLENYLRESKK